MNFRDRIKELRRVPASELLPNPKNWRTHPDAQSAALSAMLDEIGWAAACLARETPDGLVLIDGHLRTDVAGDDTVPVLIIDVTAPEADLILATLDPLSAMAGVDDDKATELFDQCDMLWAKGVYDVGEWLGPEQVNPDEIPDYDPMSETVSIRIDNVPTAAGSDVAEAVTAALVATGATQTVTMK